MQLGSSSSCQISSLAVSVPSLAGNFWELSYEGTQGPQTHLFRPPALPGQGWEWGHSLPLTEAWFQGAVRRDVPCPSEEN